MRKKSVLGQLFLSTLCLSAFTFGGGYMIVSLMKKRFADELHWIDEPEMLDLIAIAQSSPGSISVNGAIVIGYKLAGLTGALASTIGCILPSCVLLTLIARLYLKYRDLHALQSVLASLRPAVVAMIASAGVLIMMNALWSGDVTLSGTNWVMAGIFVLCLVLLRRTKWSPILIMALGGVINFLFGFILPT